MTGSLFRRRRAVSVGLGVAALAPLVDVMSLLLLFLLRAFSADSPVEVPEAGFQLARSASEDDAPRRLPVDVTNRAIYVDGARIVGSTYYLERDDAHIRELYTALLAREGEPVDLRVDRAVPYRLVRKALFTAREAGVTDVSLIAASRSGL